MVCAALNYMGVYEVSVVGKGLAHKRRFGDLD